MDFFSLVSSRLAHIENYLASSLSSCRLVSLGRLLEVEALALSFRNESLITGVAYDQFDLQCETLRRRYKLHSAKSSFYSGEPYNGRFLEFQAKGEGL